MSDVYLYPLAGIPISVFYFLYKGKVISPAIFANANSVSVLFHYFFLSFFVYRVTGRQRNFMLTIVLFSLPVIFLVIFDINFETAFSFSICNFLLLFYSVYYFYSCFKAPPIFNLSKNPGFLICSGVLLGSGLVIPFSLFNQYLISIHMPSNSIHILGVLATVGYLIINLFFFKAILCLKHPKVL
jgi:magnesium-transporting ATPase (P-type)